MLSLVLLSFFAAASAQGSASEYYVHRLPGAPPGPLLRMHAGHIEVDSEHHGGLFFWHYQNRHIEKQQRTVIWLNGGPGCSSMDGNLMEIGPYRVRPGNKLEYNNGSWDEFANLLFVDNPVGTGFSYVDSDSYLHELQEMADEFVTFLERWFRVFPEYEQDDLYIAGESYAGQHIPYIAKSILDRNRKKDYSQRDWNLKGLLIGNGWISGQYQSPSNLEFAYERGLIERGSVAAGEIEEKHRACLDDLAHGGSEHVDVSSCEAILQLILSKTKDYGAPTDQQCLNMYDIKLRDSYPSCGMNWPPDLETVTPYLRDRTVIDSIHVDRTKKATGWTECNGQVSSTFRARNSAPSFDLLPGILESVPILLFSGADDMICNHLGTEAVIENLEWNGAKGFAEDVPTRKWTFDGELAGTYREDRNLTYLLFYNSSHMVPFDYPKRSRDMLDRFMGVDSKFRYPNSIIEGEEQAPVSQPQPQPEPEPQPGPPVQQDGPSDYEKPATDVEDALSEEEAEQAAEEEAARIEQARWDAYYRSGEVALVLVIIMAGAWFWFVWRDRRRRAGYRNVEGSSSSSSINNNGRLESFRHKPDVEEGAEMGQMNGNGTGVSAEQARRYSLGSASSESSTGSRGEKSRSAKAS